MENPFGFHHIKEQLKKKVPIYNFVAIDRSDKAWLVATNKSRKCKLRMGNLFSEHS